MIHSMSIPDLYMEKKLILASFVAAKSKKLNKALNYKAKY